MVLPKHDHQLKAEASGNEAEQSSQTEDMLSYLSFSLTVPVLYIQSKSSAPDSCALMASNWFAYIISSGCQFKQTRSQD